MKRGAYAAWEVARHDILTEWEIATDPRNLQPAIPKPLRDAANLLREHRPADMTNEEFHSHLDTIEAPYDTRAQRMIRKALDDHRHPSDQINAILTVTKDLGLRPPEEIKPIPERTPEDVHLVCWVALVPK